MDSLLAREHKHSTYFLLPAHSIHVSMQQVRQL
jgi:hypothetical protein